MLRRCNNTLNFLEKVIPKDSKILDLGTQNYLSDFLRENGYNIENTKGEDLDIDFGNYIGYEAEIVTAFEIFEHMLAPYNILRSLKQKKLVASVPLKLWFKSANWSDKDEWDNHYHEFEIKQFNFLLKKSGWEIKKFETWTSPDWKKIGFRPFLRHFYPRYYIVYCERP